MLVHLLEFREEGQEQKEGEAKQREYEAITMGQASWHSKHQNLIRCARTQTAKRFEVFRQSSTAASISLCASP